ncbi:extracellular solute-binding protein [Patescibacteria group bacterium]|nr:extracellular solute-binding protein [Patescibacteria group bacterium]MBU1934482.1 extracellular solute-binding protein [Patescibacteria group bacterium]
MKAKKLIQPIVILALIVMMSIIAVGCAAPSSTPEIQEVIVTKEVYVTPESGVLPEGAVKTIPFMTTETDPDTVALFMTIISEYEAEHPDVRIDLVLTAHGSEAERLLTAHSVGAELGIVGVQAEFVGDYVAAGYLLPLDSVVDTLGRDQFKTGAVLTTSGSDYALGYAVGNNGTLWVRTDLLESEGLAVPTTYDELLAAAEALTKDTDGDGDIDMYGWGAPAAANGATNFRFVNFVWANCGEYFDKEGNLAFDNPNVLVAFQKYLDLLQYAPPDVSGWSWYDGITAMEAEKIAMHQYAGRLGVNVWKDKPELREKLQVIWGPFGDVKAGKGGYDYFAISADVRWPEEAKDFLAFFYSGDRLGRFDMSVPGHLIPPTQEIQDAMLAMDNPYMVEYKDDVQVLFDTAKYLSSPDVFMGALETDTCTFNPIYNPMPWSNEIFGESPIDAQMIEKVVVGGMAPEDAWKWAYTEMQKIADEWKAEHPDWTPVAAN